MGKGGLPMALLCFFAGAIFGGTISLFIMALMIAAHDADSPSNPADHSRPER